MSKTYRDFLNTMSNEELSEAIVNDHLLHMACNGSVENNKMYCPYSEPNCAKCIEQLLDSDMDDIKDIGNLRED